MHYLGSVNESDLIWVSQSPCLGYHDYHYIVACTNNNVQSTVRAKGLENSRINTFAEAPDRKRLRCQFQTFRAGVPRPL